MQAGSSEPNAAPTERPFSRVGHLGEGPRRFALKEGEIYTTGSAPQRARETGKERSEALGRTRDADLADFREKI